MKFPKSLVLMTVLNLGVIAGAGPGAERAFGPRADSCRRFGNQCCTGFPAAFFNSSGNRPTKLSSGRHR